MIAVNTLSAQQILVIAPHPDDESLGCGGLIALLAKMDRKFRFVFVTDGAASHPHSASWPRKRLAAQREVEAGAALTLLGAGDHPRTFLRLQDAAMPDLSSSTGSHALSALKTIMQSFLPDLIILPWRRDPHCDHRDAWTLTQAALTQLKLLPATLEYAVWLDELGTLEDHPQQDEAESVSFDISNVVDIKIAAVMAHATQTTDMINDDPDGFRLSPSTIRRLCGPIEKYWRPLV